MNLAKIVMVKILRPLVIITILTILVFEIGLRVLQYSIEFEKPTVHIGMPSPDEFVILTIGESTTGWHIFEDGIDTAWPAQLEQSLNKSNILGKKVRIINEAIAGISSEYFTKNLETFIRNYRPNLILAMVGINDYDISNIPSKSFLENFKFYKFVKLNRDLLQSTEFRNKTAALRQMQDRLGLPMPELKDFILSPLNHTKEIIYARLHKDQANLDVDSRVLVAEIYLEILIEISNSLYVDNKINKQDLEQFNFYKKMSFFLVDYILFTEHHSGFKLPSFLLERLFLNTPETTQSIETILRLEKEYFHPLALTGLAVLKDRFQNTTTHKFNRFEYTRKNLRTIAEIAKRTKVKLAFMQYPRLPKMWIEAMLSETPIDFVEDFRWSCGMSYSNIAKITVDPEVDFIGNENMAQLCKPEIGSCFIDIFHFCPRSEDYNFGHATKYGNSLIVENIMSYLKSQ